MKAISDTLYTWFMIRGLVDKQINNSNIKEIKFISPSNKLKIFKDDIIKENLTPSQKYRQTKKLSIDKCIQILNKYKMDNWIVYFNDNNKKDDLADCFLQGYSILNIEKK